MSKLHVCLCITDLEVGGAERCLTELALRIDRQRFRPTVICLAEKPVNDALSYAPILASADVPVHFLGGKNKLQFLRLLKRLTGLLTELKPDVLQTFMFHANILGRFAARLSGTRHVVAGVRVAERDAPWRMRLDRLTHGLVEKYVCVSQAVAAFSVEQVGLPREKLIVIPNGIDCEKFPAAQPANLQQFGIAPGRRVVLFVGRLHAQKGVSRLVESAPLWLERLKDADLLLVGDGPLRAELEALAASTKVSAQIHFAARRPDVPGILAAAELLVLPSAWEGMPNVVLEAMASGLSVVATPAEGVKELLGPNADRQLVPFDDPKSLAERIVSFLEEPDTAAEVGRANRSRVEEHFRIDRMVAAYEELWWRLAEHSPAA